MTEFQMKLFSRLAPMSKETFKELLEVNEDVQIFYGDPREPGLLGRAYFAAFEDNTYLISYIDWDYTEKEQSPQVVETFNNYDDFWAYLVNMTEDENYSPEYYFLSTSESREKVDPLKEGLHFQGMSDEDFEKQDITKAQLKALLSKQSKHGVLVFYDNGPIEGPQDYYAFLQPDGRVLIKATPHRKTSFGFGHKEPIHVCRNFDDFWKYLQMKLGWPNNYYHGAFRYMSDEDVKRKQQRQLKRQHAEAQDAGSWDAYQNKSLTKAQLQFRLPTKVEHPRFDLFRRKIFGPFEENYYVKAYTYPGGSPTMTVYKNDRRTELSVTTFSTINELWEYIIMMVSDHKHYEAAYKYVDPRLGLEESLTESKRDPFHEAIFEVIDYLTEFSDIFPVPRNIGAANWEELKDDINYGLSSDFEIAEILMEYLKKDLAITERHPEMFEDDPQSELTLEMYIRLKRAFDKAVAAYEAAYPEDFQESLSTKSKNTTLNESLAEDAGELLLAALEWTVGGYVGFTVGGWIWDITKNILQTFANQVRKVMHQNMTAQWIAYKSYLIEITKECEINIWNPEGELLYSGLTSLEAAKRKINRLPIPEIVSEFSVAIEDALLENPPSLADQELPDVELDSVMALNESFTLAEMEEYNMDEDGNSLDGYDTYVRCSWCDDIFTEDQCSFEANLGWLCDRCYSAITSRGERLSIISNPTDEDKARVMLEEAAESENDPTSNTSTSNNKTVNSSEIDGLDFEEACRKYNVKVES